jgi:hypothetical protein
VVASWLITAGAGEDIAFSDGLTYPCGKLSPGTGRPADISPGLDFHWSNLRMYVVTNATVAESTLKSFLGGGDGNQILAIGAGLFGEFEDTVNVDTFIGSPYLSYNFVKGSANNFFARLINSKITCDDSNGAGLVATGNLNFANNSFCGIAGGDCGSSTIESDIQYRVRSAATISNMEFYVPAPGVGAKTITFRVNGVDKTQTIALADGDWGWFFDDINSDNVDPGDELSCGMTGDAGNVTCQTFRWFSTGPRQTACTYDGGKAQWGSGYYPIEGTLSTAHGSTTEAPVQARIRSSLVFKNLFVRVINNNRDRDDTVTTRKNGAAGNLTVTIPAGTFGVFEDTTHSDTLKDGDLYNTYYNWTGGTAFTNASLTIIGVEQFQGPSGAKSNPIQSKLVAMGLI